MPLYLPLFLGTLLSLLACRTPAPIERPQVDPYFEGERDVALPHEDMGPTEASDSAQGYEDHDIAEREEWWQGGEDKAVAYEDVVEEGSYAPPIPRTCAIRLSFRPKGQALSVTVPGEWNGWDKTAHPMKDADGDGEWEVTLGPSDVPPGEWGYKFLVNGTDWFFDPQNPLQKFVGPDLIPNSRLIMPDCELPTMEVLKAKADFGQRRIEVVVQVYTGISSEPLDPKSLRVELGGKLLEGDFFDWERQRFVVTLDGLEPGKYSFTFHAANTHGEAKPLFVPLWLEEEPFSWRDAVLYFAMTDRFANGSQSNDAPASCLPEGHKANWLGGDFEGIRKKIEEGYFTNLGVNAIWISPANSNPKGCYPGDLGYLYSAYHGYFPVSLDETDSHFGSLEDLRALTSAAHKRGIRVIMDLAANHVHEESPLWALHNDWFNTTPIICSEDDNWNKHPIDCWFQPYLPDFDFRNLDALNAVTDAAIEWVRKADLDGFRVDAVKHMIHDFTRTLRYKVRTEVETSGTPFYLVGETFDSREKIGEYVSDVELNGQFDFPLYWAILAAFGRDEAGLCDVAKAYEASAAYYGPGAIMSNFLGNHDVPRFLSHAAGQIPSSNPNDPSVKQLGWTSPPEAPTSKDPYRRLVMAFSFLFTVPGVPLIYYGDEIGMPGAGDPDNRRPMKFQGWSENEAWVSSVVSILASTRKGHRAARTGKMTVITCEAEALSYAMSDEGDAIIALFARNGAHNFALDLSQIPGLQGKTALRDAVTGEAFSVAGGKVIVPVERLSARVLVPEG